MNEFFHQVAAKISEKAGSPRIFFLALFLIFIWGVTGSVFDYSDSWQLVINTSTTIITFLMVFLIQNTQNREAKAMQLKLDELIKGVKGARTEFVDLEDLSDNELSQLQNDFRKLHEFESSKTAHLLHEKVKLEHAKRKRAS